jgi:hypothetical protein
MDYEDLSLGVNEVVMVEGSVWVKDKVHHFWLCFVVPLGRLVDKTSTIDKDQASHLKLFKNHWTLFTWLMPESFSSSFRRCMLENTGMQLYCI